MFQNVNENTLNIEKEKMKENANNIFANIFAKKYIVIYIVSFMLSQVGLGGEFSIFSISMLSACFASSIPLLGVIIISLIGNVIKFGAGGALGFFLTALVMIVSLFILKPVYNEQERNEKLKVGKNIFLATILVQIMKFAITGFTIYDILSSITIAIIALVFYKIFVNALVVLQDFTKRRAFSIEEVIGTSLLLAISVAAFGDINILGFGIKNILSILIVMVLGWKNGILVGTTTGVSIGVTLGVITGSEPIMIAAYAISGMVAGILNKFGKIGVVVGFALGNIILAYVSNGYTVELIHFKEILIASIGLLAIPKNINIELEEFIGNSKLLPVFPNGALNKTREVAQNLDNVSEAIQEIAQTYKQENELLIDENEVKNENKQIFITELLGNLESYKDNMLYDDMSNTEGRILDEIFNLLLKKQKIERKDLLEIFANCNSYIVGFEDKEISQYLEDNISQIIRVINISYKISKSNFIWKKKMQENQKNMGNQLDGVSKAIKTMARNIEQEIKQEEQYKKETKEILELIKQKGISVIDISIRKETRFIIEIYVQEILETAKIELIENILTKILKEKIVLNQETTVGKKLNFISADKYIMTIGVGEMTKSASEISGDGILNIRLKDGKYLIAISDGMGSGNQAKKSSNQALKMLENLLLSGFDKQISLDLINSALMAKNNEIFATLDIAIIDLYAKNIEFIKSGACPTYIKTGKRVQIIKSNSLPTGILDNKKTVQAFDQDIVDGEILLMCSDGILDSNIEYKNKELWIKYMLEDIETTNTQKIADLIINEAVDNNFGKIKDDMSILVCKFVQNPNV